LIAKLTGIEEALYQTKNRSSQDPLNYPIRLNNRLAALAGVVAAGEHRPTEQAIAVRDELMPLIDHQLMSLQRLLDNDLPSFNANILDARVPPIWLTPLDGDESKKDEND
jgi:hypothetical protein